MRILYYVLCFLHRRDVLVVVVATPNRPYKGDEAFAIHTGLEDWGTAAHSMLIYQYFRRDETRYRNQIECTSIPVWNEWLKDTQYVV